MVVTVSSTIIGDATFLNKANPKTSINCYVSKNGYLSFKKFEVWSWIMLAFPQTIINLEYKNIIIICYYLLTVFSFNTHRSPKKWLLMLPTFYYERNIKRDF